MNKNLKEAWEKCNKSYAKAVMADALYPKGKKDWRWQLAQETYKRYHKEFMKTLEKN